MNAGHGTYFPIPIHPTGEQEEFSRMLLHHYQNAGPGPDLMPDINMVASLSQSSTGWP